ncbi:MAG: ATP-dependent protease ATPase subunit HslU [Pseudomonadota bacterium]
MENKLTLTPKEVVAQLDRYIIGQDKAKRAVAIALRNRWRRQNVSEDMRDEITPKNIIMIGPTGVGKTEIARRLAKLAQAPFIKVEASKFTEIGYVGKDVESMVRDLVQISVNMVKAEERERLYEKAKINAQEKLLDLLLPTPAKPRMKPPFSRNTHFDRMNQDSQPDLGDVLKEQRLQEEEEKKSESREKLKLLLDEEKLEEKEIEIETKSKSIPSIEIFSGQIPDDMQMNMQEALGNMFPKKSKRRKMKIKEAREIIINDEINRLMDMDKVSKEAVKRAENSGIIFLDEIDKIASQGSKQGPDVSRQGVQRDILPIVEGSNVMTKYGMIKTDHILFVASGAFHISKPSDLIPELQGRFPIRVELNRLTKNDFQRILTEPENSLTKQYVEMMKTEDIDIQFTDEAVAEISEIAEYVNEKTENIGARRLHTVMEKIFDEISFEAPDLPAQTIEITKGYVKERLDDLAKDEDLSRYIL